MAKDFKELESRMGRARCDKAKKTAKLMLGKIQREWIRAEAARKKERR